MKYYDQEDNVRAELYDEEAQQQVDKIYSSGKAPESTQLRKFYNQVLAHKIRIEASAEKEKQQATFRAELPEIRMLHAKANYAFERGHVNKAFVDFLADNLRGIKELRDFQVFCVYFEAVIAFASAKKKEKDDERKSHGNQSHNRSKTKHTQRRSS